MTMGAHQPTSAALCPQCDGTGEAGGQFTAGQTWPCEACGATGKAPATSRGTPRVTASPPPRPPTITPADWVTIDLAATVTGYTPKAIRRKIQDGVWLEGQQFVRAPDGRVLISLKGYAAWVATAPALRSARRASA
jgi:hypothetical protein